MRGGAYPRLFSCRFSRSRIYQIYQYERVKKMKRSRSGFSERHRRYLAAGMTLLLLCLTVLPVLNTPANELTVPVAAVEDASADFLPGSSLVVQEENAGRTTESFQAGGSDVVPDGVSEERPVQTPAADPVLSDQTASSEMTASAEETAPAPAPQAIQEGAPGFQETSESAPQMPERSSPETTAADAGAAFEDENVGAEADGSAPADGILSEEAVMAPETGLPEESETTAVAAAETTAAATTESAAEPETMGASLDEMPAPNLQNA